MQAPMKSAFIPVAMAGQERLELFHQLPVSVTRETVIQGHAQVAFGDQRASCSGVSVRFSTVLPLRLGVQPAAAAVDWVVRVPEIVICSGSEPLDEGSVEFGWGCGCLFHGRNLQSAGMPGSCGWIANRDH